MDENRIRRRTGMTRVAQHMQHLLSALAAIDSGLLMA
jgi:hypothetical protein